MGERDATAVRERFDQPAIDDDFEQPRPAALERKNNDVLATEPD